MDKLKLHTPDLTEANIAKLAELFPNWSPKVVMRKAKSNGRLILISSNKSFPTQLWKARWNAIN